MIVAVGVDLAEVPRIAAAIDRFGARFLDRIFTAGERRYCQQATRPAERFAARFAAKEAAMKALGTGWSAGVRWRDLEVERLASGQPTLRLHGAARAHAHRLGVQRVCVSLTHTPALALAEVILEAGDRGLESAAAASMLDPNAHGR